MNKNIHKLRILSFIRNTGIFAAAFLLFSISYEIKSQTAIAIGPQNATFSSMVRGYHFTAPVSFTICGLYIPTDASTGAQSVEVVRFTAGTPPAYPGTTNNFVSLFYQANWAPNTMIPCNIPVMVGDVIGVYGARSNSTVNSYDGVQYNTTVYGFPMTLFRSGKQAPLYNSQMANIWSEINYRIGRIIMYIDCCALPSPAGSITGNLNVCPGSTGSYSISTVSGATNYNWIVPSGATINSGQGTNSINVTFGAASGTICVTPQNTCGNGLQSCITVTVNPTPSVTLTSSPPVICGTGSANLNATGGASYSWSPSGSLNNPNISNPIATPLSTTTYTVTVSDNIGCTNTGVITVTVNSLPVVTASSNPPSYCAGGSANLNATGGITYSWSPSSGLSNPNISNPTANPAATTTYSVTATDNNGCSNTAVVTLTVNPLPTASVTSTQATCGNSNGSAAATPSGGNSPYTFLWSNGQTTSSASGLAAGNYSVTVTDANGCSSVTALNITQPTALSSASSQINVLCNGGNNASATIAASGGSPAYTFLWSNGQTTSSANNLTAGNYSATVTDANGCTSVTILNITEPPVLSTTTSQINVLCNGGNNASAAISVSGGSPAYTYLWSNGQTTSSANNLTSGNYSVTITDANSCTYTTMLTITEPTALTASISSTAASCGMPNGTASVNTSGGTPNYSYLWSNGQTAASISGLSAGNYSVTVSDANGCTQITSVTISATTGGTASILSSTNVNCFGGNNGNAVASISGGTSPFTYLWSNGQTTSSASGLSAGNYTVVISDANGCTSITTVAITQPPVLTSASSQVNLLCNGGNNASATISVSGGSPAYTYLWSNGQTTFSAINLAAGNYAVTITDANGCSSTQTITITQPPALAVSIINTTPALCGANNGTATVSGSGGTGALTYSWNTTPPQSGTTASNLATGNYVVTLTDANGCTTTQSVTITGSGAYNVTPTQINILCFGNNNGSATVTTNGGSAPFTYSWSTTPVQTTPTISNIPAGNYTCTITDASGCTQTTTYTVTQPPALTGSITSSVNVSCFGGNNGNATGAGNGGTGTINYSWNTTPAQTGATVTNLVAGNYVVTITDANGCSLTQNVTITEPTGMAISTTSTPSACGVTNGTASVSLSGGATPYTYIWLTNPIQTAPSATNLAAGTYIIIVADANGCTQSQAATVGGGQMPVADFTFLPSDKISLLDPLVIFTDGSNGNPTIWSWNFGDPNSGVNDSSFVQNPNHVYSDTGVYCITLAIADPTGVCNDTIIKCLTVEAPFTFFIPSSFTPNEDGLNEMFTGYGSYIKEFEILIFDRWGNEVFKSTDLNKGWNGKVKNKGDMVQEDVYLWKVFIKDFNNKKHDYIGRVTLVK